MLRNRALSGYDVALLFELVAMLVLVAVTLYKVLMTKSGSIEIPARIPSFRLKKKKSQKLC